MPTNYLSYDTFDKNTIKALHDFFQLNYFLFSLEAISHAGSTNYAFNCLILSSTATPTATDLYIPSLTFPSKPVVGISLGKN